MPLVVFFTDSSHESRSFLFCFLLLTQMNILKKNLPLLLKYIKLTLNTICNFCQKLKGMFSKESELKVWDLILSSDCRISKREIQRTKTWITRLNSGFWKRTVEKKSEIKIWNLVGEVCEIFWFLNVVFYWLFSTLRFCYHRKWDQNVCWRHFVFAPSQSSTARSRRPSGAFPCSWPASPALIVNNENLVNGQTDARVYVLEPVRGGSLLSRGHRPI